MTTGLRSWLDERPVAGQCHCVQSRIKAQAAPIQAPRTSETHQVNGAETAHTSLLLPGLAFVCALGFPSVAPAAPRKVLVVDPDALVARINLLMCAGQLSAANIKLIADALKATPVTAASTEAVKLNRIAAAILLVMASAEYLVQK